MSIQGLIRKVCVQTAIYWGAPISNGQGGMSWAEPVELRVRWDNVTKLIRNAKGLEVACRAEIMVAGQLMDDGTVSPLDLDVDGRLYLGSLNNLDSGQINDPLSVLMAWPIMRFDKNPEFRSTTKFVRMAYL